MPLKCFIRFILPRHQVIGTFPYPAIGIAQTKKEAPQLAPPFMMLLCLILTCRRRVESPVADLPESCRDLSAGLGLRRKCACTHSHPHKTVY